MLLVAKKYYTTVDGGQHICRQHLFTSILIVKCVMLCGNPCLCSHILSPQVKYVLLMSVSGIGMVIAGVQHL